MFSLLNIFSQLMYGRIMPSDTTLPINETTQSNTRETVIFGCLNQTCPKALNKIKTIFTVITVMLSHEERKDLSLGSNSEKSDKGDTVVNLTVIVTEMNDGDDTLIALLTVSKQGEKPFHFP